MLQTMGPNSDPLLGTMILSEIAYLKRMPALAKRLEKWRPEPDPMEQALKQAEIAKIQAEVEKLKSEIELNAAKTKEALAKADLASLDFVEQESGTKHERDMQKQRAQAQGNQALEVTKALVKAKKKEENDPDIESAIGYNALSGKLNDLADDRNQPGLPGMTSNLGMPVVT
jgi:hypothetical protein